MGTLVEIKVVTSDPSLADQVISRAFKRIKGIEAQMVGKPDNVATQLLDRVGPVRYVRCPVSALVIADEAILPFQGVG